MDNITEITCLNNEEKSCFNSLAIYGLTQEITKLKSLLEEDPEIHNIAFEDIKLHEEMIRQTCEGCVLNKCQTKSAEAKTQQNKTVSHFKSMKTKDVCRLARQQGFEVVTGKGEHGLKIVTQNGERRPLTSHSRDVSPGVVKSILGWMSACTENQVRPV